MISIESIHILYCIINSIQTKHNHLCYNHHYINREHADLGGCWWPPAYPTWTPTTVSFSFSISLIIAQFTIFGSFLGPELSNRFEALNYIFYWENQEQHGSLTNVSHSNIVVLRQIFLTRYFARQTEIVCESYDPRKLMYQFTQTGPIVWRFISWGQVFGCLCFPFFLNNKQVFEPHCNTVQRHVAATTLLRYKLPSLELVKYWH